MLTVRLAGVVLATGALVLAPVVTPVWAAPHPVAPTVHRTPLSGVDDTALRSAPTTGRAAGSNAAGSTGGTSAAAGAGGAVATARPAVFTRMIDTGRFTAAGVGWRSGTDPGQVTVQVRVRENGAWSDWRALDVEGGPDGGTAEAQTARASVATQPYSTPSGDGIQVRVDTATGNPPPDLTLITVDPGTSAADANVQQAPSGTAHGAATRPSIVARPQWGADESIRTCTPSEGSTIKVGFVHHTAGSNTYQPQDSAGIVRGIYAYHVQGNGWCDIGYNFLVDRFGTRFEGRYGSLNQPIIGAHTLAFNTNTVGVSAMGDFTTAAAPAAMMTSISQILGWKLSLYDRDPHGTDQLTSGGGTGAKWPAGTVVRFNVVSGHRDGYATGCPGDVVYNQLGSVRDATAKYISDNPDGPPVSAIDRYHSTTAGYLGAPTGPEVGIAGGAMRPYERGNIYWSAATGPHVVWGAILVKYQSLGGPSSIGFPTTDEVGVAGGAQSTFTGGSLFWSQATGARLVWGAILVKYRAVGGPASIGFPVTDEVGVAGGSRSTFTGGSVLWTEKTGARLVIGGILAKYDALGGPAALGFPTTDEVQVAGGARSTFTGGSVLWSSRTGPHLVIGGILAKYDEIGGPTSDLGFPTSDEYGVPGGARSDFERGRYIDWTPSAGAVVH